MAKRYPRKSESQPYPDNIYRHLSLSTSYPLLHLYRQPHLTRVCHLFVLDCHLLLVAVLCSS
jgi:hypothetical protein